MTRDLADLSYRAAAADWMFCSSDWTGTNLEEAMKQERIDPGWVWAKKLDISAGVKIGDTVYLSGTVAFYSDAM